MTNKLVSIIIVSWNGLHWLKRSLPSLEKLTYTPFEIILVDNSSSDGTSEWVRKNFPHVKIITIQNNLGYAEANNRGFEISKGEYILFLNNDVEVTATFISKLITAIDANDSIAGAQSKILLLDDKKKYDTIGAFLTSTGFLYHYGFMNVDQKRFDKEINIFTPKGACMIFKRAVLETVLIDGKLFDSDAFAYFEETDIAHRIWLTGKEIIYVPTSIIYHKMGGTSITMDNAFIQYHSFKNRINCYIKNLEAKSLIQILPLHLFCCEIFAVLFFLKGKFPISIAIQKAIFWNIFQLKKTLHKRSIVQKNIRKVKDTWYFAKVLKNPNMRFYMAQASGKPYNEPLTL